MVNNILIIEDNLQYLKEMLNYVISKLKNVQLSFIATSIEEAIDIINSNHIDLVFLDLKLSVSEEINVIEKIRRNGDGYSEVSSLFFGFYRAIYHVLYCCIWLL